MTTLETRIEALEKRISELESEVGRLKQHSSSPLADPNPFKKTEAKITNSPAPAFLEQAAKPKTTLGTDKAKEAFLGKYIIGALAALLIFAGTGSFISLIWRFLSPEVKMSALVVTGMLITAIGFWRLKKNRNPIAAVTLGIGAGIIFISILSANLVFHMIGQEWTLILAGIWAIGFILASDFTKLFLLIIVAYLGSLVTLILGLSFVSGGHDYWLLSLFSGIIMAVLLWTAKARKPVEKVAVYCFTFINLSCLLDGWFIQVFDKALYTVNPVVPILLNLALIGVLNGLYALAKASRWSALTLIPSGVITIETAINLISLSEAYYHWEFQTGLLIFAGLLLAQTAFSLWRHKPLATKIFIYHAVVLAVTAILLGNELYEAPAGLVVLVAALVILERVFKVKSQAEFLSALLLLDALLLWRSPSDSLVFVILAVCQIAVMLTMLYLNRQFSAISVKPIMRTIALMAMTLTITVLTRNVCLLLWNSMSAYVYRDLAYMATLVMTGGLWRLNFFADHQKNDSSTSSKYLSYCLYLFMTLQYAYGIYLLNTAGQGSFKWLMSLSLTALALSQSWLFVRNKQASHHYVGIWLVLKYLILTWSIIWSFGTLELTSAIYSVTGLLVAIVSISLGFKYSVKSIRLYGLVLTLMMVAKFILLDLSQENSLVRVIALVLGGGLCFLISYIYNRLSDQEKTL